MLKTVLQIMCNYNTYNHSLTKITPYSRLNPVNRNLSLFNFNLCGNKHYTMKDLTIYIPYKHGDKGDKHHKQVEEIESWTAKSTIMKNKTIWNHLETDFHCEYWCEEDIKFSQDLKIYVFTAFHVIKMQAMTYKYFPI